MTKSPRIQTNEGPPDKRVQIISEVVARPDSTYPVVIKPYKLDLTQFGEKVRDEITFKIINKSDQKLDLTMICGYENLFEIELPKSISAGETEEAKLKLKEYGLQTNFEKSFTFELNDEKNSRFTIPVKRTIRNQTAKKPTARKSAGK